MMTQSGQDDTARTESPEPAPEDVTEPAPADVTEPAPADDEATTEAATDDTEGATEAGTDDTEVTTEAAAEDTEGGSGKARRRRPGRAVVVSFVVGVLVGAVVLALVGEFAWPRHLLGPGDPDPVAAQITAALGAKDKAAIDRLGCTGPDGKPVVTGDILNVISGAKAAGPTTVFIDTEARSPVDLTVVYQGQSAPLPVDVVLGVADGRWCFKAISQR